MTRAEKVEMKKARAAARAQKRKTKNQGYYRTASLYDRNSIAWGRKKQHGRIMVCEMGWRDCEERGYCNGDC